MRASLTNRHLRGLHSLACDTEASEHYNEPTNGLMHRMWRLRVYLRGLMA